MRRARTPTPITDALAGRDEVTVLVRGQLASESHRLQAALGSSTMDVSRITEAVELAVERAVQKVFAMHLVPTAVTLKQAAEMLGISTNTARKLNLRRNRTGLIPYEEVLDKRKVYY